MPIYEFRCQDCKEAFDLFVRSMNAPVSATCPNCGSEQVQKEVSAFSARGSGMGSFESASSCAPSG
jgi:putative FmdB family regulatory protein